MWASNKQNIDRSSESNTLRISPWIFFTLRLEFQKNTLGESTVLGVFVLGRCDGPDPVNESIYSTNSISNEESVQYQHAFKLVYNHWCFYSLEMKEGLEIVRKSIKSTSNSWKTIQYPQWNRRIRRKFSCQLYSRSTYSRVAKVSTLHEVFQYPATRTIFIVRNTNLVWKLF